MKNTIELLAMELGIYSSVADSPRQPLDETTPGTGDVSGGNLNSQPLGIILGDLSLNSIPQDHTSVYSFTFNYNPYAKHTIKDDAVTVWQECGDDCDELLFWESVTGHKKYRSRTKQFGHFSFQDQYTIFCKHFNKWIKEMNALIPDSVIGYSVCIELTKQGILHAHSIIYSNNNYKDMCCSTARVLWAKISKGKVCAMKNAFAPVQSASAWQKYITKDVKKTI